MYFHPLCYCLTSIAWFGRRCVRWLGLAVVFEFWIPRFFQACTGKKSIWYIMVTMEEVFQDCRLMSTAKNPSVDFPHKFLGSFLSVVMASVIKLVFDGRLWSETTTYRHRGLWEHKLDVKLQCEVTMNSSHRYNTDEACSSLVLVAKITFISFVQVIIGLWVGSKNEVLRRMEIIVDNKFPTRKRKGLN